MRGYRLAVYRAVPLDERGSDVRAFGEALVGAAALPAEPASFLDPERFMRLPTRTLVPGPPGEEGAGTLVVAFDGDSLQAMPEIGEDEVAAAKGVFLEALAAAGLEPKPQEIRARTGRFEMLDPAGDVEIDRPISIRVWFERSLGGVPRVGPGAKVTATFDPWGEVTHYRFAWREVEPTEKAVDVYARYEVEREFQEMCRRSFPDHRPFDPEIRLVYYLPPVEKRSVELILPHYLCGGSVPVAEGAVDLLEMLTPAVDARRYADAYVIPTIPESALEVPPPPGGGDVPPTDSVPAYYYFLTENPVSKQYGALEQGLVKKLRDYHKAPGTDFSWSGAAARQRHFKDPGDLEWVDNADLVFFSGHGFGGGAAIVFDGKHRSEGDYLLYQCEVERAWGDQRLEWLALYSCNALSDLGWRIAFNGLHLLMGFATKALPMHGFSGGIAQHMLTGLPVAAAWLAAVADHQRDIEVGAVMGAIRKRDLAFNYEDRYHGVGPVGPDIPADEIGFFFRVTGP